LPLPWLVHRRRSQRLSTPHAGVVRPEAVRAEADGAVPGPERAPVAFHGESVHLPAVADPVNGLRAPDLRRLRRRHCFEISVSGGLRRNIVRSAAVSAPETARNEVRAAPDQAARFAASGRRWLRRGSL